MASPELIDRLRQFVARYRTALLVKAALLGGLGLAAAAALGWRLMAARPGAAWSLWIPAALALGWAAWLTAWLRRVWIAPRRGAAYLDEQLGLQQRLVTAAEFSDRPTPPPLYALLVEDAASRVADLEQHLPRPWDRSAGILTVLLAILLLWPLAGRLHPQLASLLPTPPSPTPDGMTPPPPDAPQQQDQNNQSGGGGTNQNQNQSQGSDPNQGQGQNPSSQNPSDSGAGSQQSQQPSNGTGQESSASQQGGSGQQGQQGGQQQAQSGDGQKQAGGKQSTGNGERGTGNDRQGQGQGQQRAGNGTQGTGSEQQGEGAGQQQQVAQSGSSDRSGQTGQSGTSSGQQADSAQSQRGGKGGTGSSPGDQEALKAEIQQLLREVSGELQELQQQLAAAPPQNVSTPGTGTDPKLYESPMPLTPQTGAPLSIQLPADAIPTSAPRPGGGVGAASREVLREGPSARPEDAQLSDQPLEEPPSDRQVVPPEYRSVFDQLRAPQAPSTEATPQ
jgi:hypothetical protein